MTNWLFFLFFNKINLNILLNDRKVIYICIVIDRSIGTFQINYFRK